MQYRRWQWPGSIVTINSELQAVALSAVANGNVVDVEISSFVVQMSSIPSHNQNENTHYYV